MAKLIFENEQDVKDYLFERFKFIDTEPIDKFCIYDMYDDLHLIEIKVRYDKYPSWIIEKAKYRSLMSAAKKQKKMPYYVVAHQETLVYYNLGKIPFEILEEQTMKCPKTTEFANNEFVMKKVYLLPKKLEEKLL